MSFLRLRGLVSLGILASMSPVLNGCSSNYSPGTQDTVVVTPSTTGTVSVVNGGSQAVTLSFNSSDANAISKLSVTSGLSMPPAGWIGPPTFNCAAVRSGSGCVLTLTYAPTADASGAFTIAYSYTNSDGARLTGSTAILYASTAHDSVSASAAPSGQINAIVGASQVVALTFVTDDGNAATALSVTTLNTLPAGWTSSAGSFACATVSTGSGCLLPLTFAPSAAGNGVLTLDYTYTDNAGTAQTGTATLAYAATAHDNIVGTAAPSGQINAIIGGAPQSVGIFFTTDDHSVATALALTTDLTALPSGWSTIESSFACASVSIGNGCQLLLSYAPSAANTGTLTLNFSYRDSADALKTGSLNVAYAATAHNNVVATTSPAGQVNAVIGAGAQSVGISFTTDDHNLATALTLTTDLSALPDGWTATGSSFACASVSTGNGCQLLLSYAPSVASTGTLSLTFTYHDSADALKTGSLNVAYAATAHNNVVATASPAGQVNAVIGGAPQSVGISFTTDDHNVATALTLTTDLTALPNGWNAVDSSFACANVSTGNGCQLLLSYAPSVASTGTLALSFGYRDSADALKTGSVNVAYAATTHNNVGGTASPSGQVNAVVGAGAQSITVNFTADSDVASGLTLTTALNSLPVGWTSAATSLTCASVTTSGSACQLPLSYAPAAVGSGTLTLNYSYTNNAGSSVSGTVSIPYASTVHDTVSGAVSPSGTVGVLVGASQAVTVVFTTSDGNTASGLAIASGGSGGIGSLPSGWSVAGAATTFACSSISSGAGCSLNLSYAPVAGGSGTLELDFSYFDNAGAAQSGTVSIAYAATALHAYVSDSNSGLYMCSVDPTTGTLANCQTTGGFTGAWSVAFFIGSSGNYAYVVDGQRTHLYLCTVNSDGTLSSCAIQGSNYSFPEHVTVSGLTLYMADQGSPGGGEVTLCAINSMDGSLSACFVTASAGGLNYASGVTLGNGFGYVETDNNGLFTCAYDSATGLLTSCAVAATSSTVSNAWNIVISSGVAYVANSSSGLATCSVDSAGVLSSCSNTSLGSFGVQATGTDVNRGRVYVSSRDRFGSGTGVYLCPISGITVSSCALAVSDGSGGGFRFPTDVIIH